MKDCLRPTRFRILMIALVRQSLLNPFERRRFALLTVLVGGGFRFVWRTEVHLRAGLSMISV